MHNILNVEVNLAGVPLIIETGKLAKQAGGSVTVQWGDTIVFCAATMSRTARTDIDFFPLTVDYEERKYAVGKIPGGFMKRGGRPSEKAILTSRLIDRPLRPLFPDGMRNEVQIAALPLSVDRERLPDVLAINAASAALMISNIPWAGPVGAVRVGRVEGEWVINPSLAQCEESELDLVVAATKDAICMVEAGANEVSEDIILEALLIAQEAIRPICDAQIELAAKVGKAKTEVPCYKPAYEIVERVRKDYAAKILTAIQDPEKASREAGIQLLKDEIVGELSSEYTDQMADLKEAADKVVKEGIRDLIINHGVRPDGRKYDEIRPISCEVGILPRVHGSGLFTRGQTQVLTTCTLGPRDDAQIIDTLEEDGERTYMHFYNFPPYSVGETRPMRGPGRREIGHGALAERALRPVIPNADDFPYTMLLTSEVMESNGSSSMASTCGSTLALMDAGVKIKSPVAGIAMGLMTEGDKFVVLSDIQGMEDFTGDMDFKVTGTAEGVTAMQLDTKCGAIPHEVFVQALAQAKVGRFHILGKINEAIEAPREDLSMYAPRMISIEINPERIGELIGPGGRTIKKICADTGARIQVEQDGRVFIAADSGEAGEAARKIVSSLTKEVMVGEEFTGKVTRTASLGVFVEIVPGKDGLVPMSQLSDERVRRADELVKIGDEIKVKVIEVDQQGRINLTAKGLGNVFTGGGRPGGSAPSGERSDRGDRGDRGFSRERSERPDRSERAPRREAEPVAQPDVKPEEKPEDDDMPRARFRPRR
ncbi:MAG: polyribonucleotide nucleotidyltransferase [Armatimonadota bacterium]